MHRHPDFNRLAEADSWHADCIPDRHATYCNPGRRAPMSIRPVKEIIHTRPTVEGAGVKLERAFGFGKENEFDPFLLLDELCSNNPGDYLAGFPWHPHRGMETISYVLAGSMHHADSVGNKGKLSAGILHQEMPKGDEQGRIHGFQLWANLPLHSR
jgi:quercetin 2,3-dioxygenase